MVKNNALNLTLSATWIIILSIIIFLFLGFSSNYIATIYTLIATSNAIGKARI